MLYVQDDTAPSITPVFTPAQNDAHWNNSEVTVSFVCTDTESGVQTCPAPITVSDEGIHQIDSGPATDKAGNSASITVTVNVDMTQPDLVITSPADAAVVHQTSAQLSGTVVDSLSGLTSVTCNGFPVNFSTGLFTCNLSLNEGLNSIPMSAMDNAGNVNAFTLKLTYTAQSENTYTFYPTGDAEISNVLDYGSGTNYGLNPSLQIESSAAQGGVLVQFAADDLLQKIGTQHVISATLQMYAENSNSWDTGANVDVHRLLASWDEPGVTYDCRPSDDDLNDPAPNCDDVWSGGYSEDYVTDSIIQQNQLGWQNFNVTSDVQLFTNGISDFGWMIRKRDFASNGTLDYTSIQGNPTQHPRLVVMTDDQPCAPTTIDQVTPGEIPADGSLNTITISGTGLSKVIEIFNNANPIPFTIVDDNTITFADSASSDEEHQIQLKSSCVAVPLDVYTIHGDSEGAFQAQSPLEPPDPDPGITCSAHAGVTLFSTDSTGKYLCFNSKVVRLIGYGAFETITFDGFHCQDENNCSQLPIATANLGTVPKYMQAVRYYSADKTLVPHGVNLQRIMAFGADNADLSNVPETMPFRKICGANGGKYCVGYAKHVPPTKQETLLPLYLDRLKKVLTNAKQNGQVVELTLFPGDGQIVNGNTGNTYTTSPWNPDINNMYSNSSESCPPSAGGLPSALDRREPFPEFYKICTAGNGNTDVCTSLNCLGRIEKNYVDQIVNTVRTGNTNSTSFKNVIFEIMNEAPLPSTKADFIQYVKWHRTVASWIKSGHQYFVSANPVHGNYANLTACCSGCTGDGCTCTFSNSDPAKKCDDRTTMSGNGVFLMGNINIVTIHSMWCSGTNPTPCEVATAAAYRFKKPVILDDDGGCHSLRDTNCNVKNWSSHYNIATMHFGADSVRGCTALGKGRAHFNHLDENKYMPANNTVCNLTSEGSGTNRKVDCNALHQLAYAQPSDLCAQGLSCSCPANPPENYCLTAAPTCPGSGHCDNAVQSCP
jgi:hypothetical protein